MIRKFLLCSFLILFIQSGIKSQTLQDMSSSFSNMPQVTIYTAKEIITLDPYKPKAEAVAVKDSRIMAVGSLEEVKNAVSDQTYNIDTRFSQKVIVPGFIAQHDHPILAALTMETEILAIEDWVLPTGTIRAVKDRADFLERLSEAEKKMTDPDEPLVSWGYHSFFYGELVREDLDKISATRPILVWHRSAHEFTLNTAALKKYGVTEEFISTLSKSAQEQSDFKEGRFWEQGLFGVVGKFVTAVATPDKLRDGLEMTKEYMHSKGITLACEPGGILVKSLQDFVNSEFSGSSFPFRFYFIPDAKSLVAKFPDDKTLLEETKKLASWYNGMTSMLPNQVKLFSDGAIYSQLMQVRDPYLDGHKGEWLTDPELFERLFALYWDAGYQIHVHVNGDAGLDRVLNTVEKNMVRNLRNDHRTVIVHFAVSASDQVERIKKLGCIVSGNPYYTVALADVYSKNGLGPERSDQMVRIGDVERSGISFSFHSDMPMAPADPLYLMYCAVNRITTSGRIAGENQRVSRTGALKAVTLDAAFSLQLENEVGSIVPDKLANFTILDDDPVTCDPLKIKDIAVWGTIVEGRVLKVYSPQDSKNSGYNELHKINPDEKDTQFGLNAMDHIFKVAHGGDDN